MINPPWSEHESLRQTIACYFLRNRFPSYFPRLFASQKQSRQGLHIGRKPDPPMNNPVGIEYEYKMILINQPVRDCTLVEEPFFFATPSIQSLRDC